MEASLNPPPVRGAIIAGGAARRFGGGPKGLAVVGGERVLDRLVAAFQEALGADPLLVANDPEAANWSDLRVTPDVRPGTGALGGLYSAVVIAPAPVVCVAWDMPFVSAGLLRGLAEALAGNADAVLPASGGRRGVEPLCAAYGPSCRAPMEDALDRGDLRAIAFHEAVRTCILSRDEIRAYGPPDLLFFNVNTPEDLTEAERLWRQHGSSQSSGGSTLERPR